METRTNQILLSADKPYTRGIRWGTTIAYTYTDAEQNRLTSDEHYAFDVPTISDYPFQTSNAASKHRLVMTGNVDVPWGITLAGKLTLATPIPVAHIGCCGLWPNSVGAQGEMSAAYPVVGTPRGSKFLFGGQIFGYRDIDLQATKNIDLGHGMVLQIRFDALNVFNFKNYSDYERLLPGCDLPAVLQPHRQHHSVYRVRSS